jgi:1-acyl-sn-glycerol-3-phosphate acyltransferase
MFILRFVFRFTLLIFAVLIILPLVVLILSYAQRRDNRKLNKSILNKWSLLLCRICGLKIVTKGKIQKNPVFLVANHVSWIDIPVIHCFKLVGFVAKEEIASWPFLGWAVKSGETVFIARGKIESRKQVLLELEKRLNDGRSVAVFPEGRATNGEKLGRFHRQLMQAAVDTQTPIQAIAIKYLKKDGSRNKEICFRDNERFVGNVIRVLALPKSIVELNFCDVIDTQSRQAKELSHITYDQVAKIVSHDDYM